MDRSTRATRLLKVFGKAINLVMIFINGIELLGPDHPLQRLIFTFKKLEENVGNDSYYQDFLSLIVEDEKL